MRTSVKNQENHHREKCNNIESTCIGQVDRLFINIYCPKAKASSKYQFQLLSWFAVLIVRFIYCCFIVLLFTFAFHTNFCRHMLIITNTNRARVQYIYGITTRHEGMCSASLVIIRKTCFLKHLFNLICIIRTKLWHKNELSILILSWLTQAISKTAGQPHYFWVTKLAPNKSNYATRTNFVSCFLV